MHRHLEGEGRLEDDEHRAEVGEQATTALRNQILLDTLAEQLEIKVSQNELLDYLVNASRQYGMDPNTFIQTIDKQGQIPTMVAEVARSKALAVALRRVAVTDGSGQAVDLSEFIGSDAEDAAEEAARSPGPPRRRPTPRPTSLRSTCSTRRDRRGHQGLSAAPARPRTDRPVRGLAVDARPPCSAVSENARWRDMGGWGRALGSLHRTGTRTGDDRAVQDRRHRQTREPS